MRHAHAPLVLALVVACGPKTDLDPLPGARRVVGIDEGVAAATDGVRALLQTSAWPGPTPIQQRLTPVRITLINEGDQPVAIRYREFALVTDRGERLPAIPPFEVRDSVEVPVVAYGPIYDPGFRWSGFHTAPWYGPVYPGISPWGGPFAWDPWYADTYGTYWLDLPLPSVDMLRLALPEGVLTPGGELDGWLYFPAIDGDVETVTFEADLVDATTNQLYGAIRIPYDAG